MPVVRSLLKRYNAAVDDPQNELTYLYEIRDALAKEFDGEVAARSALASPKMTGAKSGVWRTTFRPLKDAIEVRA